MKSVSLSRFRISANCPIIHSSSRSAIGSNYGFFRIFKFLLITKLYETSIILSVLSTTFFLFNPICATAKTIGYGS